MGRDVRQSVLVVNMYEFARELQVLTEALKTPVGGSCGCSYGWQVHSELVACCVILMPRRTEPPVKKRTDFEQPGFWQRGCLFRNMLCLQSTWSPSIGLS